MIILHVITTLDSGGAENHLLDLVKLQSSLGHSVSIAYLQGKGELVGSLCAHGIYCIPLHGSSRYFFRILRSSIKLRSHILAIGPDVVHAHMPPAEITSWLSILSIRKKVRYVISKHLDGSFFHGSIRRKESFAGAIVASLVMLRASRIIAISQSVSQYLFSSYFFLPISKVAIIYYGIDSMRFAMQSADSTVGEQNESSLISIGTAARLVPQKNIDILLKAFAKLHHSPNLNIRLVIAGDGPLKNELQDLSCSLGIQSSVLWLGQVAEIEAFMQSLDIFVLASRYEGLGLVLLEAMSSALPVVASNISAIPEIVVDGQTGLLCDVGMDRQFSEAIEFLATMPSIRRNMGLKGLERVNSCFSLRTMVEKTMSAYT